MATAQSAFFAIAAPGLEPLVAAELTSLGERPGLEEGGVAWQGDARSMMRANLWLRTASRVLLRVAEFRATKFFELEKRAKKVPWPEFLAPGHTAEFRVTARKSKLYHSDAIAERLLSAANPSGENPGPSQLFVVRVHRDVVTVSADTSGELLHQRGYRLATAKAPLRETLAAALLHAARWDGSKPLVDPFCGSGTIPIEAALLARRIAPGLERRFAFMAWPAFDATAWSALMADARSLVLSRSPVRVAGSDRDAGAIRAAQSNASRAGVAEDIEFARQAVSAARAAAANGLVATNPPYGVRVGGERDVRNLYARFGDVLRSGFGGWTVALYAPASGASLLRQLGLPLETAFRTSNGGIRVSAQVGEVPKKT